MSRPPRREKPTLAVRIRRDLVRFALALVALAALAISANFGSAVYVAWSIDRLAAGRAACMVVATGDYAYRPVVRLMDLSVWSMRAMPGFEGLVWSFHGVLLVDEGNEVPTFFNWSWSRLRFDRGNLWQYNAALWPAYDACRPEPGFGTRLLFG